MTTTATVRGSWFSLAWDRLARILMGYGPLVGLLLLMVVLSIVHSRFLTLGNLLDVLDQTAIVGVAAFGMTAVLITGGLDLSIGTIISVSGLVGFIMIQRGYGTVVAIAMGLAAGAAMGSVNAVLVTVLGVSSLVVTIATSFVFRSMDFVLTKGGNILYAQSIPASFAFIYHGSLGPITNPIVILLAAFLISYLVLNRSRFGRFLYATGGQIEVARLSGIRTKLYMAAPYVICGVMGAIGGIMLSSRVSSGQSRGGDSYVMDAIATTFVGATMFKGTPTVIGTFVGALLLSVMSDGLTLMNVNYLYQNLAKGLVFALAVLSSSIRARAQ